MSVLGRIREWRPRRPVVSRDAPPGMVPAGSMAARARQEEAAPQAERPDDELLARRDRLAERFTMMQADLGGVFYEMAIRDHVRMDVLTGKAAELQRIDADLAAVERQLRGEDGPAVGSCPSCGTPRGATARFCLHCGHALAAIANGSNGSET